MVALVASGRVAGVWRWPVKSLGGERVPAARLDHRGLAGDRAHLLLDRAAGDGDERVLTARQAPGMLRWSAAYPSAPGAALAPGRPPAPVLTGPDGRRWRWDDPDLAAALAADLAPGPGPGSVPARLRRLRDLALATDPAGRPDLPGTVLVTTAASLAALGAELGGAGIDPRRFRPNLHLELDAPPFAELGWEGMTLTLGGGQATIELLHPCTRCAIPTRDPDTAERWPQLLRHLVARHGQRFGVNARAAAAGLAVEGAPVTVTAP